VSDDGTDHDDAGDPGSGTGVVIADDESSHGDALAVRHEVFVEGQGVPEALEVDAHEHEASTTHFVAYDAGEPIGAARMRRLDDATVKAERVAVLADRRGEGWGRRLMDRLEREAAAAGATRVRLHAQTPVEAFYHRLDYRTTSEEFEEAGIPHVAMEKPLDGG
jgi:predicted GNAT family N-acyltransferase